MMEKKDGRTDFYRSTKDEKSSLLLYSQVPPAHQVNVGHRLQPVTPIVETSRVET